MDTALGQLVRFKLTDSDALHACTLQDVQNLAHTFRSQALLAFQILADSMPDRADANVVYPCSHSGLGLSYRAAGQAQHGIWTDQRSNLINRHVCLANMNSC